MALIENNTQLIQALLLVGIPALIGLFALGSSLYFLSSWVSK